MVAAVHRLRVHSKMRRTGDLTKRTGDHDRGSTRTFQFFIDVELLASRFRLQSGCFFLLHIQLQPGDVLLLLTRQLFTVRHSQGRRVGHADRGKVTRSLVANSELGREAFEVGLSRNAAFLKNVVVLNPTSHQIKVIPPN